MRSATFLIAAALLGFGQNVGATSNAKPVEPLSKSEARWSAALVAGNVAAFSKYVASDAVITSNSHGMPAPSSMEALFKNFKGCKLSKSVRGWGSYYLKGSSISFDCGRGYDDVLEYAMTAKKITALHFFANAPCLTRDCS